MSALIKELLLDMVIGNVDPITKIDIEIGIKQLYQTQQISAQDIQLLDKYLSGYTIYELQQEQSNAADILIKIFCLLEDKIQYLDEYIIQLGLSIYPRYAKIAPALRSRLDKIGREL